MSAEPVRLEVADDVAALGPEWDGLFAGAGLQMSREWLAATAAAALPAGAAPRYLAAWAGGEALALLPMVQVAGGRWQSLTTPYTCLFQPLLRPGASAAEVRSAALAFGRYSRRWPVTRLEALDPDWDGLPDLRAGFARAGLITRTFEHFGNWHGEVPAGSWDAYLQSRPGALRETIRRRTRAAGAEGVRIEILHDPAALEPALAAYDHVYARSWKEPEPFPRFNAVLVRALASTGTLRIGLMWAGDRPIAAQYWTAVGAEATVLKLAHDEEFKHLSPGTVLTAAVIRSLIECEGVTSLDFGRGDDAYKRGWTGQRRPRIGLIGLHPLRPRGLHHLVRHDAGRLVRTLRTVWAGLIGSRAATTSP